MLTSYKIISSFKQLGLGLLTLFLLAACSEGIKGGLGMSRDTPDEFKVIANSPLSIPPDFSMRPPATHKIAKKNDAEGEAQEVVFGQASAHAPLETVGEEALLAQAKVSSTNPSIREILAQDNTPPVKVEKTGFFKKLIPSSSKKEIAPDAVVDATAEQQRLQQNKQAGKPVTDGETPTIVQQPSTLDKLLGKDKTDG